MSPWTPLISAACLGALGLFAFFVSHFEGWKNRTAVVLCAIGAIVLGYAWLTMGMWAVFVALAVAGGGCCVMWVIWELVAASIRKREKREEDERNKRWIEQERKKAADRAEQWAVERAEQRRKTDERRVEGQREAARQAEKDEARRKADEERRKRAEEEKARRAKIIAERDPDMPF